jgi:hypothetical protein
MASRNLFIAQFLASCGLVGFKTIDTSAYAEMPIITTDHGGVNITLEPTSSQPSKPIPYTRGPQLALQMFVTHPAMNVQS